MKVWEIEAGGLELKRVMKEDTDSEYTISQKLAYEIAARRSLEAEFEVVLKSLQSDQITIAGYEVELNDLKSAANYAMSCIPVPEEGEQQQSIVDRLVDTPNRLLTLLRVTGLAAVGVLDRQTYQGGTRGSRLCGEDRNRETENSKVCARTWDTRFIQVWVAKVANPTSCLGDQVWRPALSVG
jgi:hypothetical protein